MALMFPVAPMKAAIGSLPTDDDAWAFEIKWDGYRMLLHCDAGRTRLQSSSGLDMSSHYPELGGFASSVNASSAIIDGEIVVLDADGRPRFEMLQRHDTDVAFYAFDVVQINGVDTTSLAYEQRRALLDGLVEPDSHWMVPAYRIGGGRELLDAASAQQLEGVMAKRLGSIYVPGKRSTNWRKVKVRQRVEFVVGGYSRGSGSRSTTFGSLLVGLPNADGSLRFAGGVGSGFTQRTIESLFAEMRHMKRQVCPFSPAPPRPVTSDATWIEPSIRIVAEIAEFTNEGLARHATFIERCEHFAESDTLTARAPRRRGRPPL